MGIHPHRADPSQEPYPERSADDAEPRIPQPLPQDDRRFPRAAIAMIVVALAIIVLVVVL